MAYFKLLTFSGIAPQVNPRLLKDEIGQTAEDVNLDSGVLSPIKANRTGVTVSPAVTTLADANKTTVFEYQTDKWLQFNNDVDVVRSPILGENNDTIYFTGDGFPKMGRSTNITSSAPYPGTFFRLGVPAPTAAPTIALNNVTSADAIPYTSDGAGSFIAHFGINATKRDFTASGATVDVSADSITDASTFGDVSSGERVLYFSGPNTAIGGLTSNELFYVSTALGSNQLTFHTNYADAVAGTNKIDLTSTSSGTHTFLTFTETTLDATATTVSGSFRVTITSASDHGLSAGTKIELRGFSAQDGITAAQLNKEHEVASRVSNTSFTIITEGTANASSTSSSVTNGLVMGHKVGAEETVKFSSIAQTDGLTATELTGDFAIRSVRSPFTFTINTNGSATSGDVMGTNVTNGAQFRGLADGAINFATTYVYTFVTAFGEEGPPSAASEIITADDNVSILVSNLETSTSKSNDNFAGGSKRIYRSNTGSSATAFQFVAEVPMATTSFVDGSKNSELAEVIPTTTHIGPPDDDSNLYPDGQMLGLTALPNGIFAGFTGRRVCFSEPYLPHAWPASYRVAVEEDIVGLGATTNGLVVLTEKTPYFIAGSDPKAMSIARVESYLPCLSKNSIVDMGEVILYASPDGIVAIAGTQATVLTRGILSSDQWLSDFYPSSIKAGVWKGRYVGFFTDGDSTHGGFILDTRTSTPVFTTLSASNPIKGVYSGPDESGLYVIISNGIEEFQDHASNFGSLTFKSKRFTTRKPTSMSFVKAEIEGETQIKVFGDGSDTAFYDATIAPSGSSFTLTGTTPSFSQITIPEPIMRLPSNLHKTFEIEVTTTAGSTQAIVNEICIAESIDEIRAV